MEGVRNCLPYRIDVVVTTVYVDGLWKPYQIPAGKQDRWAIKDLMLQLGFDLWCWEMKQLLYVLSIVFGLFALCIFVPPLWWLCWISIIGIAECIYLLCSFMDRCTKFTISKLDDISLRFERIHF